MKIYLNRSVSIYLDDDEQFHVEHDPNRSWMKAERPVETIIARHIHASVSGPAAEPFSSPRVTLKGVYIKQDGTPSKSSRTVTVPFNTLTADLQRVILQGLG